MEIVAGRINRERVVDPSIGRPSPKVVNAAQTECIGGFREVTLLSRALNSRNENSPSRRVDQSGAILCRQSICINRHDTRLLLFRNRDRQALLEVALYQATEIGNLLACQRLDIGNAMPLMDAATAANSHGVLSV